LIVKLYFDVSAEVQEARLNARSSNPWQRVIRNDEEALSVTDPGYSAALAELRGNTDTRWSPWRMIDGDDEARAALSALSAIADAWAEAMPAEPPHLVGKPTRAA
jgi:polyphosphate kinase 2 (PPK2 family)